MDYNLNYNNMEVDMAVVDLKNYVDAMLETSSVAAHDISGQIHVMQFCVDELEEHTSGDGNKYLSRLQSSLDELTGIISSYRVYIKKAGLSGEVINSYDFMDNIVSTLKINFWNEFKKISFSINAQEHDWKLSVPCAEVHSAIFSTVAIYIEELKKGVLEPLDVELTLKKLDSQHCQFTLRSNKVVDQKIFKNLDEDSAPGAKVLRKNLGHEILLSSELYDLNINSSEDSFEILLNMKVIDE